jgi:hypothetical protein
VPTIGDGPANAIAFRSAAERAVLQGVLHQNHPSIVDPYKGSFRFVASRFAIRKSIVRSVEQASNNNRNNSEDSA